MRIIAGEFKARKLLSPPRDVPTRPMTDRVRESIFNLLRGHFEDQFILDLFAGSGSIGLEAISRGAARCLFVELSRKGARTLQANVESLGVADRCEIVIGDALSPIIEARLRAHAHLIFLDPPYDMMTNPRDAQRVLDQMAALSTRLDPDGYLVLRTPHPLPRDIILTHDALLGPETHDYNSMSIHLYQQPRG